MECTRDLCNISNKCSSISARQLLMEARRVYSKMRAFTLAFCDWNAGRSLNLRNLKSLTSKTPTFAFLSFLLFSVPVQFADDESFLVFSSSAYPSSCYINCFIQKLSFKLKKTCISWMTGLHADFALTAWASRQVRTGLRKSSRSCTLCILNKFLFMFWRCCTNYARIRFCLSVHV